MLQAIDLLQRDSGGWTFVAIRQPKLQRLCSYLAERSQPSSWLLWSRRQMTSPTASEDCWTLPTLRP